VNKKRNRRIGSIKTELLCKSREAAIAAVQTFNNPNIQFKAESYIVLMIIAWTYLLHAYYRSKKIEHRYFKVQGTRRKFDRTKNNAYKYWELERCINDGNSPLDGNTENNLRFLIGLRHEIEHQMTTRIDDLLSARFQACCLNYNHYLKTLFANLDGIEKYLSFSLQFSTISTEQKEMLVDHPGLPKHIQSYVQDFDSTLNDEEYGSQKYAYRILFVPKSANRKGQADRVIEFVKSDSKLADDVNRQYAVIKETEKPKYLPGQIVKIMNDRGFPNFNMHHHTELWKKHKAKEPAKGYGTMVAGKYWHWYERWVNVVLKHCQDHRKAYL
jgi:hypothetical protein